MFDCIGEVSYALTPVDRNRTQINQEKQAKDTVWGEGQCSVDGTVLEGGVGVGDTRVVAYVGLFQIFFFVNIHILVYSFGSVCMFPPPLN